MAGGLHSHFSRG